MKCVKIAAVTEDQVNEIIEKLKGIEFTDSVIVGPDGSVTSTSDQQSKAWLSVVETLSECMGDDSWLSEKAPAVELVNTIIRNLFKRVPPSNLSTLSDKLVSDSDLATISNAADTLQFVCHELAYRAGWWTNLDTGEPVELEHRLITEKLMLISSEVSEAFEGHRKNSNDDHLPHRKMIEVELADAVIRIFDLAGAMGLELGEAIAEKLHYNTQRADHKLENRRAEGGKKC